MKKSITSTQSINTDLAALLLRLIIGGLFIYHGYGKIVAFSDMYASFPDLIGIGGKLSFVLVVFAEFFCGILVALGFLTRFAIIPITITMAVAYFIAHKADPFQAKELAFVFMVLSVVIFILGSGKASLDKLVFKK